MSDAFAMHTCVFVVVRPQANQPFPCTTTTATSAAARSRRLAKRLGIAMMNAARLEPSGAESARSRYVAACSQRRPGHFYGWQMYPPPNVSPLSGFSLTRVN